MTQDNWQDCPTMKSVVEAMERGDEIEYNDVGQWYQWTGNSWDRWKRFRCRPAKPKTKKVVLEELEITYAPRQCIAVFVPKGFSVRYRYTGNERTEEVPC